MVDEPRAPRSPRPAVEYGPTGGQVAKNVRRLRRRRRLTIHDLAERLRVAGRPVVASGIAKIERLERQVNVDDFAALAVALGVSPGALLLPLEDSRDESVEVTGAGLVSAVSAWAWANSQWPLPGVGATDSLEYALSSLPPGARESFLHPAARAAQVACEEVVRTLTQPDNASRARLALERALVEVDLFAREQQRAESA
ncbi:MULTISPECIES: helix-turn-helix domain-containing protein [Streptomyces]|uniref:helix-turn-helix domain-containing protein n=1 Tax=Streptomyces TaxID=1883 RepID=UPI0005B8A991|nr:MULTISPECIES: helix-turn-helix transcriptional regulator [Streptomyces]MDP9953184.1 transcriptional regulator with XRE-family HTH domain [Streptomyces sp. DSM 41269]